ncbi:MAG: cell wall hydrolase, partial [Sphingomonadaceae bacterium]|nr:cell wall hydrolase [Sphingomonadaceae bacterium]
MAEADDQLLAENGLGDFVAEPAEAVAEPTIDLDGEDAISIQEAAAQAETIIEQAEEANEAFEESAAAINDARDDELHCLAKVILHESRGEPRSGQLAVAQVVMNRVESPRFPNSICGVIYQRSQFSNIRGFTPRRSGAMWER